ncbi:MAG: ankyrin repeat protein [Candidatus Midichloriaceae bacterium]|jgi:ankyrin repeat protein
MKGLTKEIVKIGGIAALSVFGASPVTVGIGSVVASVVAIGYAKDCVMNVLYSTAAVSAVAMGNNKLSNIAVENANAELFDYTISVSKALNKAMPGWFQKIDVGTALVKGIDAGKSEMVQVAIENGANVNKEYGDNSQRPLEKALALDNAGGNQIAEQLLAAGSDLSKGTSDGGNLFHKVLETGKKELVEGAMKQAAQNPSIAESTDKDGNTLAHIEAVSPDVREVAKNAGVKLTEKAVSSANHKGDTGVDVVMHGYKHGKAASEDVKEYVAAADATSSQKHFGTIAQDEVLRGQMKSVVEKAGFNTDLQDEGGSIPLDHAVKFGSDEVTNVVAEATDVRLLQNQHVWQAHTRGDLVESVTILQEKGLATPEAKKLFFMNPTGQEEGTFFHMVAQGRAGFDSDNFANMVDTAKEFMPKHPFLVQDKNTLTPFQIAVMTDNTPVVQAMLGIMQKDGLGAFLPTFVDQQILASICNHGYVEDVLALEGAGMQMNAILPAVMQNIVIPDTQVRRLTAPAAGDDSDAAGALVPAVEERGLVVKEEFLRQEEELLAKIKYLKDASEAQAKDREDALSAAREEEKEDGMPVEKKLKPMDKPVAPKINTGAAVSGELIKQAVMYKGMVKSFTGNDIAEDNIAVWSAVFTTGGYLESFGKGHSNPLKEGLVGGAVYGFTEWMLGDSSDISGYTSPEDRGIVDFTSKYGTILNPNENAENLKTLEK